MNGLLIKEIYVLGIKQYGYWFMDQNGCRIEKSVWAGITRDSLTFKEVESLYHGDTLVKTVDSRFFKSIINLNVSVKPVKITVSFKPNKKLVNNVYLPPYVNNLEIEDNFLKKLSFYFKKLLDKVS